MSNSRTMEKVTLLHVAEAADVSVSTASRTLTGKTRQYRIREETERTVREAANRMGFEPSHLVRSLRTKRSGLLGIVVPDISNPFFAAIAREITIAFRTSRIAGYKRVLQPTLASPLTVARQDAALLGKRAAKLLLSQRSSSNRRPSQIVRLPVQLIRHQPVGNIESD